MPDISFVVQNIAALATVFPFDKDAPVAPWKFRKCPYAKGLYTLLVRHDGASKGLRYGVSIGTTEVVQESDASAGGTDGVMPTPAGATACPANQFYADYNDEIVFFIKETGNVATTDVMVWANVEPAA